MVDDFGFDLDENGPALASGDFTMCEIATSIVPALVAVAFLGFLAVLMMLYRGVSIFRKLATEGLSLDQVEAATGI